MTLKHSPPQILPCDFISMYLPNNLLIISRSPLCNTSLLSHLPTMPPSSLRISQPPHTPSWNLQWLLCVCVSWFCPKNTSSSEPSFNALWRPGAHHTLVDVTVWTLMILLLTFASVSTYVTLKNNVISFSPKGGKHLFLKKTQYPVHLTFKEKVLQKHINYIFFKTLFYDLY